MSRTYLCAGVECGALISSNGKGAFYLCKECAAKLLDCLPLMVRHPGQGIITLQADWPIIVDDYGKPVMAHCRPVDSPNMSGWMVF